MFKGTHFRGRVKISEWPESKNGMDGVSAQNEGSDWHNFALVSGKTSFSQVLYKQCSSYTLPQASSSVQLDSIARVDRKPSGPCMGELYRKRSSGTALWELAVYTDVSCTTPLNSCGIA